MVPAVPTSKQSPDSRPPDGARKATLLCPECDHQSPPAGDWDCRNVGDREIRRCPECKSVVERRPVFDADGSRTAGSLTSRMHSAFVRSIAAFRVAVSAPARAFALAVCRR